MVKDRLPERHVEEPCLVLERLEGHCAEMNPRGQAMPLDDRSNRLHLLLGNIESPDFRAGSGEQDGLYADSGDQESLPVHIAEKVGRRSLDRPIGPPGIERELLPGRVLVNLGVLIEERTLAGLPGGEAHALRSSPQFLACVKIVRRRASATQ